MRYIREDNKREVSNDTLLQLLLLVLYRMMLDLDYKFAIVKVYGYTFGSTQETIKSIVVSYIILALFLPGILRCLKRETFSDYIVSTIFLIAFIPGTSFYCFKAIPAEMYFLWCTYFAFLLLFNSLLPRISNFSFTIIGGEVILDALTCIFALLIVYIWARYAHFRVNFDLYEVYEFRSEASTYNLPTLVLYVYGMSHTVLGTLMVYYIYNKNLLFLMITVLAQLISFFIDGSKSVLFILCFAFVGYFFCDNRIRQKIVAILVFITGLGFIEQRLFNSAAVNSSFIRRVFFLPADLNVYYYKFFKDHPVDYFRQSVLRLLGMQSPYDKPIKKIIGFLHTGYWGEGANNGLFSDAYANLGMIGMIILPLLIIIAIRIMEAMAEGIDIKLLFVALISVSLNILSSSFFTVLLTHGFILLCFIFCCIPKQDSAELKNLIKKRFIKES